MYSKRIYFNLLKTPVHLLYGCTFFFLCTLVVCWWWYWYRPLVAMNESLEYASSRLFAQTQLQKESAKHTATIQKKCAALKSDLKKNSGKQDDALCALLALAQKNGMSVQSAKLCRQKNKSWCTMQELQLESKGTLAQLIAFFDAASTAKPLMSCKNFQITRTDKDVLNARMIFHTYVI